MVAGNTKPSSRLTKPASKNKNYKVLDSQNCGLPNFPSSSKAACADFEAFLETQFSEGWAFVCTRTYSVGVEVNSRYMHIFKKIE